MILHYNYTLKHRLVASILLLSLFLQSCGNGSNSIIRTETEKDVNAQALPQDRQLKFLLPDEEANLINKIRETYEIDGDRPITFESASNGIINNVFMVKNNDQIISIIKCYRSRNMQTIKRQTSLIEEILKHNFPIPQVNFVFPTSEDLPVVCMEYCKGTHKELDHPRTEKVAALMANFHRIPAPRDTPEWQINPRDFDYYFEQAKDWEFTPQLKKIFESIDLSYLSELPQGLIHGDLSISNVIFDEDNKVAGVLDFDDTCKTYLLTDLTYAQVFHGFDEDGNLQEDKIIHFLRTYDLDRKITDIELDNFYNHLKLQLILTAFILHGCVVTEFINPERFTNSKSNQDVKPEVLAKKAISIADRSSIKIN